MTILHCVVHNEPMETMRDCGMCSGLGVFRTSADGPECKCPCCDGKGRHPACEFCTYKDHYAES